jgi:hypothetical protein
VRGGDGRAEGDPRRDDAPHTALVVPEAALVTACRARAALVVAAARCSPPQYLGGRSLDDHELVLANPAATPGMAAWNIPPVEAGAVHGPHDADVCA